MLAGCSSSTLLSPRHRLRSESPAQLIQACHYQLPSMSTQRLDLPCTFSRNESSRSQPIRPVNVGLSIDTKPLRQNIRLPPLATTGQTGRGSLVGGGGGGGGGVGGAFWETKGKSLKRFAEQGPIDEPCCTNRVKRIRGSSNECDGGLWFQSGFELPRGLNPQQVPFSLTCSGGGDEERVCFVPSDVIAPPLPLSNNPWLDSVVTEISDLGEKDGGESSQRPGGAERSGSSSSSESHGLGLRLSESTAVEQEVGNGSRNLHLREGTSLEAAREDENQPGEYSGFELVSLLTECVEAIGSRNVAGINHFISKLGDLASPRGNTAISRLAAYYTEALALRVTRLWPHVFHLTPPREMDRGDDDSGTTLRLLNQISPIPKFVQYTANEVLLRAFEGKDKVHIIDFDIKQGLQWPSLFQSLASRSSPPSHVRITGIGESKQELNETGDRLFGFAEIFNLPFEFHPVVDRLEDVRLWMLHVKERETVAVSCAFQMHKTLYDPSGGVLRDFLGLIRSTNPVAIVMAEQEAEHNVSYLEARVCNSLKYYSAVFDLVDSVLPSDSGARIKIEEMYAREIRNVIACEGRDRLERHESFGTWKKLMEQEGFRCLGISDREMLQSQMLLRMYSSTKFEVQRQGGPEGGGGAAALTLTAMDQPLITVSAWSPSDLPRSSSSFSQPI